MGEHDVHQRQDPAAMRRFTRQIISDVHALEYMISEGMFETGVRRIGAEQELFMVDKRWQPAPLAEELLNMSDDPRLVSELTRFNLEINLDPLEFKTDCLSRLQTDIELGIERVRVMAAELGAEIAMSGILPTIHASDLSLENMAPMPRYFALNDAIMSMMEGTAQYQIRGVDELFFQHDNIMVEGCNTSFQTHFQVSPDEFPHYYNLAQLVAGPVLAAACNSPVLFGKRLWRETRIALFQQAVDMRSSNLYLREMSPRVHFGSDWVQSSVTEVYKEDISRFRAIMTSDYDDAHEVLQAGGIPKLQALQLHNGTVYRWNRACYGIMNGRPHLRIENRILPAGPSVIDEVANSALWFGLVTGLARMYDDITGIMDFDDAKSNFIKAARQGLASEVDWLDGKRWAIRDLILKELLPIAKRGLESCNISEADIDKYLTVIHDRVDSRMTGSQWQLESLQLMKREGSTRAERLDTLVSEMVANQKTGKPGHTWDIAHVAEDRIAKVSGTRVEHYMSTDLFTVHEDELVEFVAVLMDWRDILYVLVEDHQHRLVGIVNHKALLRLMAEQKKVGKVTDIPVSEIMVRDPISITPETLTLDAIQLMRKHNVGALPVVRSDQLVGIVTEADFSRLAARLIGESLRDA